MGGRSRAATVVAAASLFVCIAYAGASAEGGGANWLIFSGADLWRKGGFLHGGFLYSPAGLDREGFTFKLLLSGGAYRYLSGALGNTEVRGRELTAQFLPGWRFKNDIIELKLFAGLDIEDHKLSPDDPSSGLRGEDTGARFAFELWSEPVKGGMFAADGSVSTIGHSYSLHAATGLRVFDRFYTGPETGAFASGGYHQYRFGLHLTGAKSDAAEWSAAAGWATDDDDRSGAYMRLGVIVRR
jgi:hypothetical protein